MSKDIDKFWSQMYDIVQNSQTTLVSIDDVIQNLTPAFTLFSESIQKLQPTTTVIIDTMQRLQPTFASIAGQIEQMQKVLNDSGIYSAINSFKKFENDLNQYIPALMSSIELIEISPAVLNTLPENQRHLLSIMSSIETSLASDFDFSYDDMRDVVDIDDDVFCVSQDIQEALEDPQNWQQKLWTKIEKWKSDNPIIAAILIFVFHAFINIYISPYIIPAAPTAIIRNEPGSKAITHHFTEDQVINVVGEVPHYYEIKIINSDNKEAFKGYISKQTFKKLKNDLEKN